MDEELQGDKFIRIIVEEIKYDLAIDATALLCWRSLVQELGVQTRIRSSLESESPRKNPERTGNTVHWSSTNGRWKIHHCRGVELAAYDNYGDTIKNSYVPPSWMKTKRNSTRCKLRSSVPILRECDVDLSKLGVCIWIQFVHGYNCRSHPPLGELRPDEYPELTELLPEAEFLTEKTETRTYLQTAE